MLFSSGLFSGSFRVKDIALLLSWKGNSEHVLSKEHPIFFISSFILRSSCTLVFVESEPSP